MSGARSVSQYQNSRKSPWRSIPLARDTGQRFEVRYFDRGGKWCTYGYAAEHHELEKLLIKLRAEAFVVRVRVIDRRIGTRAR